MKRFNIARRHLAMALPLVSMVFLAASSPQCARFDDKVLSPTLSELSQPGVGNCIKACVEEAQDARTAEMERFRAAIKDCESGSDCRAREAALHVANMQQIADDERACKEPCHEQGRGRGGQ